MAEIGINLPSMLPGLNDLSRVQNSPTSMPAAPQPGQSSQSFLDTLKGVIGDVNETQKLADKAAQDFVTGQARDLHSVMMAMEKADLALRTVTSIRNKAVEAYQEIMKMPV